ncbi:hypothetical protein D3C85_552360 [compost metagenome]
MHADHAVDDEFQARQAHAGVRQLGEVEGAIGVTDVHHDLERQIGHGVDRVLADVETQFALEDETGVALGAGYGDALAVLQHMGGIAAADHCRNTQLARDDRRVAGAPATVGDDGAGALHDRFPVRVGHIGNQHVAGLYLVHLGDIVDHPHLAGADLLANGAPLDQHGAGFLEQVTLHHIDVGSAFYRLGAGLDDIQLAVIAVFGPFDVHRPAVVLLDDHGLLGQFADFGIGQAEARALGAVDIDHLDRLAGLGFVAVDHLDRLAAQVAAQDSWPPGLEGLLVHIEFVGVDRALHHGFAEAVGAGDEHHVAKARLGVEGEHHPGGAGFRTHHALHTGRQGHQLVVEALMHAVGDGAVVEQRGEYFLGRADHVVDAADVQEGFLLAGEGSIRQVFGSGRRAHGYGHMLIAVGHGGEGGANLRIQFGRERCVHHPLADLRTGLGQSVDVVDIEGIQRRMDLRIQAALLEKIAVGLSGSGETTGNRYTGTGKVADHLAQGGVLAPYVLNIVIAELIEGNYVLYQGDLSTKVLEKLRTDSPGAGKLGRLWPGPGK